MIERVPLGVRLPAAIIAASGCLAVGTAVTFAEGLPQQASDTAVAVLAKLGVVVPGPSGHDNSGATAPATTGKGVEVSALAKSDTLSGAAKGAAVSALASGGKSHAGDHPTGAPIGDAGKGSTISALAQTTTATGVEKGAVISTAATAGASQAGQHGNATEQSSEGSGAGETNSAAGATTAAEHSDGHSSAGAASINH
jgi:hypothetical protein